MQITDRSKDVIKSGGEWISSIEMENLAVGHPGVAEAAVIGVRHPKWDERPLLVVVLRRPADGDQDECSLPRGQGRQMVDARRRRFVDEILRTPPPARSRRRRCANASRTTCCRPRPRDDFFERVEPDPAAFLLRVAHSSILIEHAGGWAKFAGRFHAQYQCVAPYMQYRQYKIAA